MIEITPHTRLIRHHIGSEHRWQLHQKVDGSTYTAREIWQPASRLMSTEQATNWLSGQSVSLEALSALQCLDAD